MSTTLFTMSYEDGLALVNEYNKLNPDNLIDVIWISELDKKFDTQYSLIKNELFIAYTANLDDKINK